MGRALNTDAHKCKGALEDGPNLSPLSIQTEWCQRSFSTDGAGKNQRGMLGWVGAPETHGFALIHEWLWAIAFIGFCQADSLLSETGHVVKLAGGTGRRQGEQQPNIAANLCRSLAIWPELTGERIIPASAL